MGQFDALGRRISKQVLREDGRTSLFAYGYMGDRSSILLAHKSGEGRRTDLYLDGLSMNEHLGSIEIDSHVEDRRWGWNPARDHEDFTGRRLAFATDHLGSVLNSKVAGEAHLYGAFGESLGSPVALNPSTPPVVYGFQGMVLDPESGRYCTPHRCYNPATGTWLQPDPIGFSGGDVNLYRFVNNNPLRYTDPNGQVAIVDDAAEAAGAIVIVGAVVGIAGGVATYQATGSFSQAFSAFGSGFVSGALGAGAAILTAGTSTLAAVGLGATVDVGVATLTAPTAVPSGSNGALTNGINTIVNPPNSCPSN